MQYELKCPVDVGDKKLEKVDIKEEWLAGDFIEIQDAGNTQGQQSLRQVALATDQPDPVVKKMSIEDFVFILNKSTSFFTKPMKKGKANT